MGASELVATRLQGDSDDLGYIAEIIVVDDRIVIVGGTNHQPTVLVSSNARDFERRKGLSSGLRSVVAADGGIYMVGEYGLAAFSEDWGGRWTRLATGTSSCLFAIARGEDGVVWCAGDEGYCARLVDKQWRRVSIGSSVRVSELYPVDDRMYLLGFDGTLRVASGGGDRVDAIAVGATKPLTAMCRMASGTLIVTGDGGFIARSVDGGKTFARVASGTDVDLESIAETADHRLIVVGDRATVMVSSDDGTSWQHLSGLDRVDGHLWYVAAFGGGVLIGGDAGAIHKLAPAGDDTWADRANVFDRPRHVDQAFEAGPDRFFDGGLRAYLEAMTAEADEDEDDEEEDDEEDDEEADEEDDEEARSGLLDRPAGPDDFAAVWGVPMPDEAERFFLQVRGADAWSTFDELRLDGVMLPDVEGQNLFELIVRRDQAAYLGTGLAEAFAGVFNIGSQRNGDTYHMEVYAMEGDRQIVHWDHEEHRFSGVFADRLSSLVYLASLTRASDEGVLSKNATAQALRRLHGKVAPTWHYSIEDRAEDFERYDSQRRNVEFWFYRARWIISLLKHDGVHDVEDVKDVFYPKYNDELPKDQWEGRLQSFAQYVPTALYAMWRAYLFDEPELATYLDHGRRHAARLVRDAATLIDELRSGTRTRLGSIADVGDWLRRFRALDLDPRRTAARESEAAELAAKEQARRAAITRELTATPRHGLVHVGWRTVGDGLYHRVLVERLVQDAATAEQIQQLDDLRGLDDTERARAIELIAGRLDPVLEAILVGALIRGDNPSETLERSPPAGGNGGAGAPAEPTAAAAAADDDDDGESPGWSAIDAKLKPIYGDQKPQHFAPALPRMLGGNDPLDGISVYLRDTPVPHFHFVTYGFTDLHHKETDDPETSGFGFELTLRLARAPGDTDVPPWALDFLQNLARYVFGSGNRFDLGHKMNLNGPIALGRETAIRAICFAIDPELVELESSLGKARFLQVVGITLDEYDLIMQWDTLGLIQILSSQSPLMITDLDRRSVLADPALRAEAERRVADEGSSQGGSHVGRMSWQVDGDSLQIEVPANTASTWVMVMKGRILHGRAFSFSGDPSLRVEPAATAGFTDDDGDVTLQVSEALAREIAAAIAPRVGVHVSTALPGLTIEIVPSLIRDHAGRVVDVIGVDDADEAQRLMDGANATLDDDDDDLDDADDDEDDEDDSDEDEDEDDSDDDVDPARVAAALPLLRRALELAPSDDDVQFTYGMMLIDAGQLDELMEKLPGFEAGTRIGVTNGLGERGSDRFAAALDIVLDAPIPERILGEGSSAAGSSGAMLTSYGDVAGEMLIELVGHAAKLAPDHLHRLLPHVPADVDTLSTLAWNLFQADKRDHAMTVYRRILALPPPEYGTSERVNYCRALNNACIQAQSANDVQLAVAIADQAQPFGRENPYIFHSAACAYVAAGDLKRAFAQVVLAAEFDYEHMAASHSPSKTATYLETEGDLGEIRSWPEFIDLFARWRAAKDPMDRGTAAYEDENYDLAIRELEKAAARGSPLRRRALINLGLAYLKADQMDAAWRVALEAQREWPADPDVFANLVFAGREQKRLPEIIGLVMASYREMIPDPRNVQNATYVLNECEQHALSVEVLEWWKATRGPIPPLAYANAVNAYAKTGRATTAIEIAKQKVEHDDDATSRWYLAMALGAAGDIDGALAAAKEVLEHDPDVFAELAKDTDMAPLTSDPRFGALKAAAAAEEDEAVDDEYDEDEDEDEDEVSDEDEDEDEEDEVSDEDEDEDEDEEEDEDEDEATAEPPYVPTEAERRFDQMAQLVAAVKRLAEDGDYFGARRVATELKNEARDLDERAMACDILREVVFAQNDHATATAVIEEWIDVARQLIDQRGGRLDSMAELARALGFMAELGRRQSDWRAVYLADEERAEILRSLRVRLGDDPELLRDLGASLESAADAATKLGDGIRAEACREEAVAVRAEIPIEAIKPKKVIVDEDEEDDDEHEEDEEDEEIADDDDADEDDEEDEVADDDADEDDDEEEDDEDDDEEDESDDEEDEQDEEVGHGQADPYEALDSLDMRDWDELQERRAIAERLVAGGDARPAAYVALIECMRRLGEHDAALELGRRNAEIPEVLAELFELSCLRDDPGAGDLVPQLRGLSSEYGDRFYNLAARLQGVGKIDHSIALYRGSIAVGSPRIAPFINIGIAMLASGRAADAAAAARAGIDRDGGDPNLYANLLDALARQGDRENIVAAAGQAEAAIGTSPRCQGCDSREAPAACDKGCGALVEDLMNAWLSIGDPVTALKVAERNVRGDEIFRVRVTRARALAGTGRIGDAMMLLDSGIGVSDAASPPYYRARAAVAWANNDFATARGALAAALISGPTWLAQIKRDPSFAAIADAPELETGEPVRPETVPGDARWVAKDKEWEQGTIDGAGHKQGPFRYWRPDGTPCNECAFVDNEPHGPFKRFHETGEVSQDGAFDRGNLHGVRRWFAIEGTTSEHIHADGMSTDIRRSEMTYEAGRVVDVRHFDGAGRRCAPDGTLYPDTPPGVPPDASFRPGDDGGTWVSGEVDSDGKRDGSWKTWNAGGALIAEETFRHGDHHGPYRKWFADGTLSVEGEMADDERASVFRYWRHRAGDDVLEDDDFPTAGVRVVRCERDPDRKWRYYDAGDRETLHDGTPVAELPSMYPRLAGWLSELDAVDWAPLHSAGGENPPGRDLVRALLGRDEGDDEKLSDAAYGALYWHFCHQGTVYSGTAVALPFIIRLVGDPDVPHRVPLMGFVVNTGAVGRGRFAEEEGGGDHDVVDCARAAMTAWPAFRKLLDDDDPGVRAQAARMLGSCFEHAGDAGAGLHARLAVETDPVVRGTAWWSLAYLGSADDAVRAAMQQPGLDGVACALGLVMLHGDEVDDTVVARLVRGLDEAAEIDDDYTSMPWSDDDATTEIAQALAATGRGVVALDRLVAGLDDPDSALAAASGSLQIAAQLADDDGGKAMHRVAAAIAASTAVWTFDVNLSEMLEHYDLPTSRAELAAWAKPDDEDEDDIETSVLPVLEEEEDEEEDDDDSGPHTVDDDWDDDDDDDDEDDDE